MSKASTIQPKLKKRTTTLFIRSVDTDTKKKFYDKSKSLGYAPKELFEKMVKKL